MATRMIQRTNGTKQGMTDARRRNGRAALALLPLILLCGCDRDKSDPLSQDDGPLAKVERLQEVKPVQPRTDILTGQAMPVVSGGYGSTLYGVTNSRPRTEADEVLPEAGYQGPLAYYMAKCDVYWKLDWVRKQITGDHIPAKLDRYLARTRRENHAARQDGNAQVADEALDHLEAGLSHWKLVQALNNAGVRAISIPWTSGASGVQAFIDGGGFGFGAKRPGAAAAPARPTYAFSDDEDDDSSVTPSSVTTPKPVPLTPKQETAISLALRHADRYHAAPDLLAQAEWQIAIGKINRLGDQLALSGRAENRDSATARVDAAMLRHAAELSNVEGGLSDQDYGDGTTEGKLFERATRPPADPFGDKDSR